VELLLTLVAEYEGGGATLGMEPREKALTACLLGSLIMTAGVMDAFELIAC